MKLGIIGHPLGHTLSPMLHAHLLRGMDQAGEYRPYEIKPEDLERGLKKLAAEGIRGLNVTIPHKVTVMPLLDHINPEAELVGAVNTIVFSDSGRHKAGYNTDLTGFIRSLPESVIQRLPESNILVLGAGGSARAVLAALIQLGTAEITFAVRNPESALPMTGHADLIKQFHRADTRIHLVSLHALPDLSVFEGVINTTPIGMWPQVEDSLLKPMELHVLPADAFVYDLIYRPLETKLLRDARLHGLQTFNGLDMLIYQGVAALELWMDKSVPVELIAPLRETLAQTLQHS